MTDAEYRYVKEVLGAGLIQSPCLELGVRYETHNCKNLVQNAGIKYVGTDMEPGKNVDYITNFENPVEDIKKTFAKEGEFGSVLVTNILAHVFEPIKVLDNVFAIIRRGGTCVIIAPSVWPINNYPIDCWRLNPNFFEEYTKRRSLYLYKEHFQYIGFGSVYKYSNDEGGHVLPAPSRNKYKMLTSRMIHKLFNTYGRGMLFPSNVAIGVVIRK